LELAIDCCPDQKARQRLNAIHLLLCGGTFELTLKHSRATERCLQMWISRFNDQGIDGITYRPKTGRPRLLTTAQVESEILPLVDDPGLADQTHWTATKLVGWLAAEKQLLLSYSTLVRYLHEHGYRRKIPRPMPEPKDREVWEDQREAFAFKLLDLLDDGKCEVFFGDEAGFEGDPRPRQRWAKRGERITQGYFGGHLRRNVVGAVNPQTGKLVSLIVPHCNTEVFQVFLDTMAGEVPEVSGNSCYLVLDNASWHKAKALNWHHITPVFLPPYSPDFNPIERLWQHLKSHYLAGFLTNDAEVLTEKLIGSIRSLMKSPETLKSVCRTHS
jgi:transposase